MADDQKREPFLSSIRYGYLRFIVQSQILIILLYGLVNPTMPVKILWRIDPLLSISAVIAGQVFPLRFFIGTSLLVLSSVFLGRAFCGWICPLGLIQDLVTWIKALGSKIVPGLRAYELGSTSGASTHLMIGKRRNHTMGHVIFKNVDENIEVNEVWLTSGYRGSQEGKVLKFFEKFARNWGKKFIVARPNRPAQISIFRDAGYQEERPGVLHRKLRGKFRTPEIARFAKYVLLLGGLVMSIFLGWTFLEWITPLSIIPRMPAWGTARGTLIGVSILLFVLVLALVEKRWWCRYICPLGGFLSLLSVRKPIGIAINEKRCIKCLECERSCTMDIIDVKGQTGLRWDSECIACFECRDVCPRDAIGLVRRS